MGLIYSKTFSAADVNIPTAFSNYATELGGFVFDPKRQRIIKRTYDLYEILHYNTDYTDAQVETTLDNLLTPNAYSGVFGRATASNTYYYAIWNSFGNMVQLIRMVAGAPTVISNYYLYISLPPVSHFQDVKLKLLVSGTGDTVTLQVWFNDTLIIDTTDTSASRIVTTGRWGLLQYGRYDTVCFKNCTIYDTSDVVQETYDYTAKQPIWIGYNIGPAFPNYTMGDYGIHAQQASINSLVHLHPYVLSDVDATVRQYLPATNYYLSIYCCSNAGRNQYIFYHVNSVFYLAKRVLGTMTTLAQKSLAPGVGYHTLRVQKNGTTFNCWIDDVLYAEFTDVVDNTIYDGWVSLLFYATSSQITSVSVSSVDTTPPSAPSNPSARWTPNENIIAWTNPSDADLQKIVLESSSDGVTYAEVTSWDTLYGDTLATSYKDTAAKNKFYRLYALDEGNNQSAYSTVVQAKNPTIIKKLSGRMVKDINQKTDGIEI